MSDRMHIGSLAKSAGVTVRTIKYYEELGLLVPESRTDGGFRVYTDGDVPRVEAIRKMRAVGLSLGTIKEVLTLRESISESEAHPLARVQLEQLIMRMEDRLRHVDESVERLKTELAEGIALHKDLSLDIALCRQRLGEL